MQSRLALQGLTAADLAGCVPGVSLAEARRVIAQVHRDEDVETPNSAIRRVARDAVRAHGYVPELALVDERRSRLDPFVKYALRTNDGHVVETVKIPLEAKGRISVCVSSQAGCALACAFCATGRLGLARNLEAWELVEQVRVVRRRLGAGERIHGVVFQGMGEPLANVDRVIAAIAVLSESSGLAIDARCITVCTSGLPAGIRRLARSAPRVRLALSIASARVEVRRSLMPIERTHALPEVIDACAEHARLTGLSPMWAVTLLAGVNESAEDAHALADLVLGFTARTGRRPRVSILAYNAIAHDGTDPFSPAQEPVEQTYRQTLRERGVFSHRRYSGGSDVGAACGQLAGAAGTALAGT